MSLTTKLNAVNTILSTIGSAPVNSLDQTSADASIAELILDEVSREVQSRGWHFNTEFNVPLARDGDTKIPVSSTMLKIDINDEYSAVNPVVRGTFLYDVKNRQYTFTEDLKATVTYLLDFTELPEAARRLVNVRAARVFQDRFFAEEKGHAFTQQDELRALTLLEQAELETGDYNILDNNEGNIRGRNYNGRRYT